MYGNIIIKKITIPIDINLIFSLYDLNRNKIKIQRKIGNAIPAIFVLKAKPAKINAKKFGNNINRTKAKAICNQIDRIVRTLTQLFWLRKTVISSWLNRPADLIITLIIAYRDNKLGHIFDLRVWLLIDAM